MPDPMKRLFNVAFTVECRRVAAGLPRPGTPECEIDCRDQQIVKSTPVARGLEIITEPSPFHAAAGFALTCVTRR
jgi:hypothetical protein